MEILFELILILQFNPVPQYERFTIAGESFNLNDGLFGLAVSPKTWNEKFLFYHPLASVNEYAVSLRTLNNPSIAAYPNAQSSAFQNLGSRGIQTSGAYCIFMIKDFISKTFDSFFLFEAQAMDCNGNLFFVLMNPIALVCWDSSTPYRPQNIRIVVQNNEKLQFASGLKIIKNLSGVEEIWIMTIRFQVS